MMNTGIKGMDPETNKDGEDDIPMADIKEIRLKLLESIAAVTLEYGALGLGMLVLWATILPDAGKVGNGNYLWIIEGLLLAGAVLAVVNSAYYGRMAGLIGWMIPSKELEKNSDRSLPYARAQNDYLSRMAFRYAQETKKVFFLRPFGNVFTMKKLFVFGGGGLLVGFTLAFV